jgi:hypothetical protein
MALYDPIPLPFDPAGVPDPSPTWLSLLEDQAYWSDGPWPCSFAYKGTCTEGRFVMTRCHRDEPGNNSVINTRCPGHQRRWVLSRYGVDIG